MNQLLSNYDHHGNVPNENNREPIKNSKYPNASFNGISEKNQPKYIDFPKILFGKSSWSLSSKWYKEFPELYYNLDKDTASCYTCISAEIIRDWKQYITIKMNLYNLWI